MPAAFRANRRSFEHRANIMAFVPCLFHRAFAILHLGPIGPRQAVQHAGDFNHLAVGEDHGGKVQVNLRPSLHPAWPLHPVNDALYVDADGDHDLRYPPITGKLEIR